MPRKTPTPKDAWSGHWIFNTNESNGKGAYRRMFYRGVCAIWGYVDQGKNLEGAKAGDKVLAYVNNQGLRAVGVVIDGEVKAGTGIFLQGAQQAKDEYHLTVRWEAIVPSGQAITVVEAASKGYDLPVRCTFAKLPHGAQAGMLEKELRERSPENPEDAI